MKCYYGCVLMDAVTFQPAILFAIMGKNTYDVMQRFMHVAALPH